MFRKDLGIGRTAASGGDGECEKGEEEGSASIVVCVSVCLSGLDTRVELPTSSFYPLCYQLLL